MATDCSDYHTVWSTRQTAKLWVPNLRSSESEPIQDSFRAPFWKALEFSWLNHNTPRFFLLIYTSLILLANLLVSWGRERSGQNPFKSIEVPAVALTTILSFCGYQRHTLLVRSLCCAALKKFSANPKAKHNFHKSCCFRSLSLTLRIAWDWIPIIGITFLFPPNLSILIVANFHGLIELYEVRDIFKL